MSPDENEFEIYRLKWKCLTSIMIMNSHHLKPALIYVFDCKMVKNVSPLSCSPELSPLKSVPQIRIDMDPDSNDDNRFFWKGRGSETSL